MFTQMLIIFYITLQANQEKVSAHFQMQGLRQLLVLLLEDLKLHLFQRKVVWLQELHQALLYPEARKMFIGVSFLKGKNRLPKI